MFAKPNVCEGVGGVGGVGMGVVGWATEWAVALREGNFPLVQPSSGSQNVSTAIQGKY